MNRLFKSSKGLFDLPSVMAGVIITAIVAGIAAASFLVVLPWMQENEAKDVISTVKVAQTAAKQDEGSYTSYQNLKTNKLMVTQKLKLCTTLPSSTTYEVYVASAGNKIYRYQSTTDAVSVWTNSVPCTLAN